MEGIEHLPRVDTRIRTLRWALGVALGILATGLWYVQIVSGERYASRAHQQTYRTVRVPALRGRILDRHGVVLADNRPAFQLVLYVEELRPLYDEVYGRLRHGRRLDASGREALRRQARYWVASNVVQELSRVIQMPLRLEERAFHRHHNQWPYRPLPLLEDVPGEAVARFLERAAFVPGVDLEVLPLRYYPHGSLAAHVLGYLTRDDEARDPDEQAFNYSLPTYQGAVGVERGFDQELRGTPGLKSIVVNSLCYREAETVWRSATPGDHVFLTVDARLQAAVARAFEPLGPYARGAAVVLDVENGDILAMASLPAYDPNEFMGPISAERWESWMNNPLFRPMFNRATQGAYPPGSIFKIVTALAAYESGVLNPGNLNLELDNPGYYQLGRRRIDDTAPPGRYDFQRAFRRSSNTYFIHYGLEAGLEAVVRMGRRLFLGEPVGLPTWQETRGFFPTVETARRRWGRGNLANVCIGQEITITPLQAAVLTAAVANGGRVVRPRLVERVKPAETNLGRRGRRFPPEVRGALGVELEFLQVIRDAMVSDTEDPEGTAYQAFHKRDGTPRLQRFRVGGKTGTAQVERHGRVVDHITWFVSYGPAQRPRYAVVVMVESGASGGGTCAPVACRIYQAIEQLEAGNQPPALAFKP